MDQNNTPPNSLNSTDHDALIELKTNFKSFLDRYTVDIKELKDGIKLRVDDHELRIKKIENDILAVGGIADAWKRFLAVENWSHDFQLRWRTIIAGGITIGSVVTFALGVIGKVVGFIK